jgi:hypothetical protein
LTSCNQTDFIVIVENEEKQERCRIPSYEKYDIEVDITLLTPEKGGRKKGLSREFNGPHIYLDDYEWLAWFTLQDCEMLHPGETSRAFVTFFFHPQELIGRLHPGKPFILHEGYHPIGSGRILSILNFEKHSELAMQKEKEGNDPLKNALKLCI